jgi:hypothetical protein
MSKDFITTIDSDDEVEVLGESSRQPRKEAKDADLEPDFEFDLNTDKDGLDLWGGDEVKESRNGVEVSGCLSSLSVAIECGRYHR